MQKVVVDSEKHMVGFILIICCVLSAVGVTGYCQHNSYVVKAGTHPSKAIPTGEQFQYPDFRDGYLYFTTGKKSDSMLLNYNLLYDAIMIIEKTGDTVALSRESNIVEFVQIQSDFFFQDAGKRYFLLLTTEDPLKLMIRSRWNIVSRETVSYTDSPGSPVEAHAQGTTVGGFVFPNEDVTFQKWVDYYFLGPQNKVYDVARSSLNKVFPDYKKSIKGYLSQNKINFTNESDLKMLTSFCNGLTSRKQPE